jgi:hypothetical protein
MTGLDQPSVQSLPIQPMELEMTEEIDAVTGSMKEQFRK